MSIRLRAISPFSDEQTDVLVEGAEEVSLVKILAARLQGLDYELLIEDSEGELVLLDDFEELE